MARVSSMELVESVFGMSEGEYLFLNGREVESRATDEFVSMEDAEDYAESMEILGF